VAAIPRCPAPAPTAPHKTARSAFGVQSPVLPLLLCPNCKNQARTHLRGRQLTARHPNSLCPAMLPAVLLPSQAVPSPRSLRPGPEGLALHFTRRSGNLTHLLHLPVHPIGIARWEMGQDSGTINAFPEKGVMLEGSQRKARCLIQPPCPTQCWNALQHSPTVPRSSQKELSGHGSTRKRNSPLAQCFEAPKLTSHARVCVEGTLQPHQHKACALKARASLQALANTQSPAPLSPRKCTGDGRFTAP